MNCPKCGSSSTIAHSATAAGSPRRKCNDCGKAWVTGKGNGKGGRKMLGDRKLTPAEKQRRYRERKKNQPS